jgi:hypothetical protein
MLHRFLIPGLFADNFCFHPGNTAGNKSKFLGCGPGKINQSFHFWVKPVVHFHFNRFPVSEVRNPDPGTEGKCIAGTGKFGLAENFAIGSFAAIEFIAVKAGGADEFPAFLFSITRFGILGYILCKRQT